jgi:hypothetical protein
VNFDNGDKQTIDDDERFLRVGPKLGLEIWPTADLLERLTLYARWSYLRGLIGDPQNSDLLDTGATFRIDDIGHALLELNYRNGEIPLAQDKTETFSVGLGLKF